MRVGPRQGGRRLGGGAAQEPPGGRRPGARGPARQDDRADHGPVRRQRRGQRVGQAVDLADRRRSGRRPLVLAGRPDPAMTAVARHGRPPRSARSASNRPRMPPAATGRRRPIGIATGSRRRVGSASTDPRGRRSAGASSNSGTPGAGADERRLEDAGVGPPADDDDVVGAGRLGQLVDDGVEDRVGRDRARQAGQDAGERFGLLAPADLERGDRLRWRIAANPTTNTRPTTTQSIGRRRLEREPQTRRSGRGRRRSRRRSTTRVGSDGPSCPAVGSRTAGWLAHVRDRGWRSGAAAVHRRSPVRMAVAALVLSYQSPVGAIAQAAAPLGAAAASWPPSRLTR